MRKRYYFILIIAGLVIVGLKLVAFKNAEEQTSEVVKEPEVPAYNPVVEIEGTLEHFDSLLDANIKKSGVVGAAAVITYKGKIALLKCYGVRKAGELAPIDKNTIFRLASVSKPITGVLASILDDENIISLEDNVVDYLPDLELKNAESTRELKVKHLLSHTSGLIPHTYDLMVEDHVPLDKILARLDQVDITAPPGQLYGYQNVLYSIYDPITQKKTQESFDEVIHEKLFEPFGMKDACTGFEAFKENTNKAYPHFNRGHKRFSPMRLNDRYYNTTPAAGINASISDLGQFLINLTDPSSDAISEHARETVFTPQVKSPLSRTYFRSWGKGVKSKQYSIGWRIVDYKGHRVAYHGGFVSGYKAEIALCEDEELGIALLCNSPSNETAQNIPAFLNLLFDQREQEKLAAEQKKEQAESDKS